MSRTALELASDAEPEKRPVVLVEREVRLPGSPVAKLSNIPEHIFLRSTTHRYLVRALEAIQAYRSYATYERAAAAEFGNYAIASQVAEIINRPDLVQQWARIAEDAIIRASTEGRRRSPRKRRSPKASRGRNSRSTRPGSSPRPTSPTGKSNDG